MADPSAPGGSGGGGSQPDARARRRLGAVLKGKYRLEDVLGVGGMAVVYLAVHRNGSRCAVKLLHPEVSADPTTVARFLREGYVANSIGHPGAVRVLDDDIDEDGAAFLVMELLEGETLHARAERLGGRLPVREVLALAEQLCDLLAAAHDKGVVHRDIKPENLFLTTERVLKVLDFGIARGGEPGALGTRSGVALGTPAFMPREQALGHVGDVDARSDVWSVGATIFTLISGKFVHDGATAGEILVAAATRPAPSLAEAAPAVPAPIVAAVDRALRAARDDRWPSARALGDALAAAHVAAFGEPISRAAIGPVALAVRSTPHLALAATRPATASERESMPTVASSDAAPAPHVALERTERSRSVEPPLATDAPSTSRTPARPSGEPPAPPPEPSRRRTAWKLAPLAVLAALGLAYGIRARAPAPKASRGAGSAEAGAHACASDRACVAASAGQPAICRRRDGACVALESEDCKLLAEPGDIGNDATVWLGAMFPMQGLDAPEGHADRDAVDLARRDFVDAVNGLPPARAGGPRRPLAVVVCDDARDPARAASHLVDDLGVPVVLGFHRSKEVADLSASHFERRGVLALAANTAPMLRSIQPPPGQPRTVLRTTTSADMVNAPIAALLADVVEPELRAARGVLAPGEPIRVAVVRVANASGLGMADTLVEALRYNGKTVAENGEAFRQFVHADAQDEASDRREALRVVGDIVAYRPHVVIGNLMRSMLPALEEAWPAAASFRPRYLDLVLTEPEPRALARAHPEARKRMFGVDTLTSTSALAKFVLRHNEVFPTKVTAFDATTAPYDAFYLAAYAIVALGTQPVSGRAVAAAIPRLLPPGEPVDVGAAGIFRALAALEAGRNVDLNGAQTSLDFDLATGDATADFAVFCLAPGRDGEPPSPVESGLVYRARTRKLEGTMRCP